MAELWSQKLKFLIIKKVTMTSQFRDESTFSSEVRTYWSHSQKIPHAKNQLSATGSFFNQFVTELYIYKQININRVLIVRMVQIISTDYYPLNQCKYL